MLRPALAVALVLASAPLGAGPARADDRPVCEEVPSDAEVRRRLEVVRDYVRAEEPAARRWYTTFMVLHGVMAASSAMLAASADQNEGQQIDMTVNTISSTLAVITLLTATPPMIGAGGTLDAMPEHGPEARLAKLREAEDILRREANAVEFVDSWLAATGTAVYTTAASTTLLVAFDRLNAAYTTILGGIVLGHGRLLLRPHGARGLWRRYRRRFPDAACEEPVGAPPPPSVAVTPVGAGLGFTVRF